MKKMTEKQLARWEKIRQGGRKRFIFLYGMLGWGVPTGILWSVGMAAMSGWDRLPLLLAISLVGFPLGGILFGWVMWKVTEIAYRRSQENDAEW